MDVRETIRTQPMRGFQTIVVAICIMLTVIDGYEILVTSFVMPTLSREWKLDATQAGFLLSAGTLGMAVGAAGLSPLADRFGRRKHILGFLALIVIGMTLSGFAQSYTQLVIFRIFAGLFLGGIVPSISALVSEYASDRRRGTVMGVYGIGFPLGAALGGFLSVWLIGSYGWRGPFFFSAAVTAILLVVSFFYLPESVSYLIERRPSGALAQYNAIGSKVGIAPATEMPPAASKMHAATMRADMWQGIMLKRTIYLWISFAILTAAFYFANTWTARLIAQATGNDSIGITVQALVATGGVIGALIFAALAAKIHPRLVTMLLMFFGTIAYFAFANFFTNTSIVMVLAVAVGIAANGGIAAFYAISPPIYPTTIRASAVGLMMGFGRGIAFLAPNVVALLLNAGWTPPMTYQLFGGLLVLAGITVYLLHRTYSGHNTLDAMETEGKLADEARDRARSVAH